jgi:hypothetical protein
MSLGKSSLDHFYFTICQGGKAFVRRRLFRFTA